MKLPFSLRRPAAGRRLGSHAVVRATAIMLACITAVSCAAISSSPPGDRTDADSTTTPPPPPPSTVRPGKSMVIGVSMIHLKQWDEARDVTAFMNQHGIQRVLTIAPKHFSKDGVKSFDMLRERIEQRIPAHFTGYACFDCEGYFADYKKKSGPAFEQAIEETIRLVEFARALRPNVKWGFYGLPLRTFYDRDDEWELKNEIIMARLIDHVDVLYPSIYDFYPDDRRGRRSDGAELDRAYVQDVVGLALRLSNGKPVLPFVSMRYHISNKHVGLHRIPDDEIASHLRAAMETEYEGRRIAGLVKWGTDHFHAKIGRLPDAAPKGSDEYLNELMLHHLCLMEKVANNLDCDF